MKDNIIFLDIDGVLNCEQGFKNGEITYGKTHMNFYEPSKKWLNKLIVETNAKIVISSTWRKSGLKYMKEVWEDENMEGNIIGITPVLTLNTGEYAPRGSEIKMYLNNILNFRNIFWSEEEQLKYMEKSNLNNYTIIDDDSDMLYRQKNHFVHVKPSPINKAGFNEKHYTKGKEILDKSILELNYGTY